MTAEMSWAGTSTKPTTVYHPALNAAPASVAGRRQISVATEPLTSMLAGRLGERDVRYAPQRRMTLD